ncbi:MAG: hypothetical protein PUG91_13700, partial [Clostridiales bacterium]|nr:hypothetical protein [Clostridiales bacterium]
MKKILAFVLLAGLFLGAEAYAKPTALTDEQANAIAMLNYITVLTQDVNASKNSRLYMEQAYSSLINNTYPNAVDSRTLIRLTGLLDTMEQYRMAALQRERLEYIYEQNQAQAIRAAVPSPMGLFSAVRSYRPSKIAAAVVYMAVDSITSYTAYTAEADLQYLMAGWALDDEEASALHESRRNTFAYMINMVDEYELPGDLTLTESSVEEFVKWKNNENVVGRIQFLESNQAAYQSYGGYWLLLAQSYYDNGDYEKCLDAVRAYGDMNNRIFRKDYELANVLPSAISAAEQLYSGRKYESVAAAYVQTLLDNTDHDDWALRYYAAQVYIDLAAQTNDRAYLKTAYGIVLDNVNYLVGEQQSLNAAYIAPVQKAAVPKDATKNVKKQIENANKALEETRKTELPPVCEPLRLNCDLLFALADELEISESERQKIDGILHLKGAPIFLTEALDDAYWFLHDSAPEGEDVDIEFSGTKITLPAACCTNDALITVTVQEADAAEPVVLTDWKVDAVKRVTEDDVSTYRVVYTSEEARRHEWQPGAAIQLDIQPKADADLPAYHFEYTTEGTKK